MKKRKLREKLNMKKIGNINYFDPIVKIINSTNLFNCNFDLCHDGQNRRTQISRDNFELNHDKQRKEN